MTSKRKRSRGLIGAALLVIGLVGTGLAFYLQGYRVYVVHTGSMEPDYMPGDIVVDKPASGSYHKGEVITFLHSAYADDVVTHRVYGITAQGLIRTKGDANRTPDAWYIRPNQVEGQALFKVPDLGYVFAYFREPTGVASLATGLFAIVLLWGIFFPAQPDPPTREDEGLQASGYGPRRPRPYPSPKPA